MKLTSTSLAGMFIIDADVFPDDRGVFARVWAPDEFEGLGLDTGMTLANVSTNRLRGTIRGMHFQTPPFAQAKYVRAVRGAVFDVAVDLRPDSPTYRRWAGVELSADNHRMLYVPKGLAHGYQTLTDDASVFYMVTAPYTPGSEGGVRWDDPAFGIQWPLGAPSAISDRDARLADFAGKSSA